jgi:cytochrome c biogenesis protein
MNMGEVAGRAGRGRHSSLTVVLLEFLGSMNLAITLLVAVAIASIIGTVLQQDQPYSDYVLQFGPFWFHVFRQLGLYDVYSAGWFLFIMAFLMVSTSVCVYRNGPGMLREIRQFRLSVQAKSLRLMRHHTERETAVDAAGVGARATRLLSNYGYRVRTADHGDHQVLAGMKGGANRLGYLLTHIGIVVILVGGLIDSKLPLQIALALGDLKVETRDIPASQVPPSSRLGPGTPSFRGNVNIPEGQTADIVFLQVKDGYLVQQLPFSLTVKKFSVKHYITGQPSDFRSQVVLHDPRNDKTIDSTIRVNHPLVYDGYEIYQASFGDGGSKLDFKLWPLNGGKPLVSHGSVFGKYELNTSAGKRRLEFGDFRMFNIDQVPGADGKTKPRNLGPSVTFKLRDPQGVAKQYMNYFVPQTINGQLYYLSGVRNSPSEPYRFLHIPAGPHGGIQRFMQFVGALHDTALLRRVAEQTSASALKAADMHDPAVRTRIRESMVRLLQQFANGGYNAVFEDVQKRVPVAHRQAAGEAFLKVLNAALEGVYIDLLKRDGITRPTQQDWVWFQNAVPALSVLPFYGSPFFLQLTDFKQIQAAGLQVTHHPGTIVVYAGAGMLVLGVFLLFFLAHRRVWVRIEPRDEGGSTVLFAGTSNRNVMDFERQFAQLEERLFARLDKPGDGSS